MTNNKFAIGQVFGNPSINDGGNMIGYRLVCEFQFLENYGAHTAEGLAAGRQSWRYKGGDSLVLATWADEPHPSEVEEVRKGFMVAFLRGDLTDYAFSEAYAYYPTEIRLLAPNERTAEEESEIAMEIAEDDLNYWRGQPQG